MRRMTDPALTVHVLAIGTGPTGVYGLGSTADAARFDLETQVRHDPNETYAFTLTASDIRGLEAVIRCLLVGCSDAAVDSALAEFGIT